MGPGHVAAVVPAAGKGARLGGERKQFRTLGGAPLVLQTIRALRRCDAVDSIVVAVPADMRTDGLASKWGVTAVIPGGDSRQASVARAMSALPPAADLVLVHDAVRPFINCVQVSRVISAARKTGAAALAMPVVDTMRYGAGGYFSASVARTALYHVQTPQGFDRRLLESVLGVAPTAATDEAGLVQRQGHSVALVAGSRSNFKITTPEDWEWACTLWPCWQNRNGFTQGQGDHRQQGP